MKFKIPDPYYQSLELDHTSTTIRLRNNTEWKDIAIWRERLDENIICVQQDNSAWVQYVDSSKPNYGDPDIYIIPNKPLYSYYADCIRRYTKTNSRLFYKLPKNDCGIIALCSYSNCVNLRSTTELIHNLGYILSLTTYDGNIRTEIKLEGIKFKGSATGPICWEFEI